MKIYLIRHGQTTGDVEDRYGGDYDDHLTDLGKRQSQNLASEIQDKQIEKIYVSPRIRARETAEILRVNLHINVEVVDNLRERNHYGILSGMNRTEAYATHPQEVDKLKDYRLTTQGGEAYEPFRARVVSQMDQLSRSRYSTIAIVSHGGFIRVIFRDILKKGEVNVQDCGYAILETDPECGYILSTMTRIDTIKK